MRVIAFSLAIPTDELLRYYRNEANAVLVQADDGRRVQLPASALRPFVDRAGVYGRFTMTIDDNNKLIDIRRV